ncbi:MAG: cation-translocating P-type ATPase [Granulosicoccaceae bacterium]
MNKISSQPPGTDQFDVYDHPVLQQQFSKPYSSHSGSESSIAGVAGEDNFMSALLQVDNIKCAGCCGKVEKMVNAIDGVQNAELNYTTHQLQLSWDTSCTQISSIMRQIGTAGYPAHPVQTGLTSSILEQSKKQLIRQFGVAGAFGMQIMVLSVSLYAGNWWGIEPVYELFFRYLSLVLVIPVLLYSAQPFYVNAVNDLRHGRIGMDVPIALGLSIAFCASIVAVFNGVGETYFDSIAMFVLLVLGARLVELGNRIKATAVLGQYDSVLPPSAIQISETQNHQRVPTMILKPGDNVFVDTGDTVPADGTVSEGASSLDESLLTGESVPVTRCNGDRVVAGSVNVENPLVVTVTQAGSGTLLSGIAQLVRKAQFEKPRVSQLVEKITSWFVLIVLSVASLVAISGYLNGAEQWLSATIAVLIVSCPCALALATPAATSMSMGNALKHGLLISNSRAVETLNQADHFFVDKTGTLTTGEFELQHINLTDSYERERAINIAVSLENYSSHPIAKALQKLEVTRTHDAQDLSTQAGGGISGIIDGNRYYLGNAKYIQEQAGFTLSATDRSNGTLAILADTTNIRCIFSLRDQIRPGAAHWIKTLKNKGASVTMLSGDQDSVVASVASELAITDYASACSPAEKMARVVSARNQGEITVMVGDGINDAPVIGAAHVSIAIGEKVNLSTANADIVIMNPQTIPALAHLLSLSSQLTRVIRQNLFWALGYNAIAIPFAAAGLVPPWLAAIGMSLSSLVVVLNATRLGQWKSPAFEAIARSKAHHQIFKPANLDSPVTEL